MLFSVLLIISWALFYCQSPNLFLVVASIIYITGFTNSFIPSLVMFPAGIFYSVQKLKNNQPVKSSLILEFIRWILCSTLEISEYTIAVYCYIGTVMIILELLGYDEKIQLPAKLYLYLVSAFWILFHPTELIIHGLNFAIEFRLFC